MSDAETDARRVGRDEMNLCEFPITLLADRVPPGCKTIAFEDRHGRLTVTGSDDYGLPTAPDSDVIVGLIQLTKLRNGFTDPAVEFTRYELLKLLDWPDQTRYYRRLRESLRRWVGVTLRYDGCWWDNKRKRRVDASFHILDDVVLVGDDDDDDSQISSSFTWGKRFFKSCRDGNLKRLDLDTYFSLKSTISKQLYRFLDKRFHVRPDWTFDLPELAFERVGLSRNYAPRKVKEKLQPALEELEGIGFLKELTGSDRYTKVGRGNWTIRLVRKLPAPAKPEPEPEPTGLEAELVKRGITRRIAVELVRDHPEAKIRAKVEVFDWLRDRRDARVRRNGPGYLYQSIVGDYPPPDDFTAERDRTRRQTAAQAEEAQARQAQARERADRERVQAYWEGLSPEARERMEQEAFGAVGREVTDPRVRRLLMQGIRDDRIRALLHLPMSS